MFKCNYLSWWAAHKVPSLSLKEGKKAKAGVKAINWVERRGNHDARERRRLCEKLEEGGYVEGDAEIFKVTL